MITECNKNSWPLAVMKITGKVNKDVEFQKFTNEWSMLYVDSSERNERFRLILDAREMGKVDMKYLYGMAKFLMHCKTLTETWMEKTAIWVGSKRIKKMIHWVFKIYKPVRPFKVFSTDDSSETILNWVSGNIPGDENRLNNVNISDEDIKKYVTDDSNLMDSDKKIDEMKNNIS
jgi:hypothetical protein